MSETFLFIDTETTGFKKSGPHVQDGQGRVCQLAMILTDDTGKILTQFSSLIKPDRWKITEGARQIHGITDEYCEEHGVSFVYAFNLFTALAKKASLIIAHNVDFDKYMMEIEGHYAAAREKRSYEPLAKSWHCTMKTNTHITGGKWPKLHEAVRYFLNRDCTSAHDAMGDAIDCRDVFFATRKAV